jgi:basic membrane lipoprotein Med (substrate-binding protein (PBP1-ABC) superfamily)
MVKRSLLLILLLCGVLVTPSLAQEETPEPIEIDFISAVCLVTDQGGVNDGTFNELALNAVEQAAEDYGLEFAVLESATPSDFEPNINTCLDGEYDAIVTVGFLLAESTLAAAEANPDVYFIGVDQFFEGHPTNVVGLQFREDQAGFLVGVMAALMTESGVVGGVYGQEIPPVIKFRNGFEQGVAYIDPEVEVLGAYIDSFVDPAAGADLAEALIGDGADIIFGAGGQTGSGGIQYAAAEGLLVIGVDQDEYFTTFGGGDSPGAENIITSALKRVDTGVYDMLAALVGEEDYVWQGGSIYILEAANDGVGYAEPHDADVPEEVLEQVAEVYELLASGDLDTGVDPLSGALLEDMMEATEEATPEG